jgi:hypothetical protein
VILGPELRQGEINQLAVGGVERIDKENGAETATVLEIFAEQHAAAGVLCGRPKHGVPE